MTDTNTQYKVQTADIKSLLEKFIDSVVDITFDTSDTLFTSVDDAILNFARRNDTFISSLIREYPWIFEVDEDTDILAVVDAENDNALVVAVCDFIF